MSDPTQDLESYRKEVREWLANNMGWAARDRVRSGGDDAHPHTMSRARETQSQLFSAGYAGITVPKAYGGQELSRAYEQVFEEESARYDLPTALLGVSVDVIGASILKFGNEEQKLSHIPRILSGEEVAVQVLSEPGAGSDLAGLLMRADRDGQSFVLNGQKIWSTNAAFADYAFCPTRTNWDVPKHQGITVFLIDLKDPGVEIRPIKQIDGSSEFYEEFITNVVVPESNIVGEENDGWRVVRGLLEIEHAWAGRHGTGRRTAGNVNAVRALARERGLFEHDPVVRQAIAELHTEIRAYELLRARLKKGRDLGTLIGAYGSLTKISSDNLVQRRAELGLELAGTSGVAWSSANVEDEQWSHAYLNSRSASIGGGTREVQRNNVAEQLLHLPREQSVDREIAFRDVPHN